MIRFARLNSCPRGITGVASFLLFAVVVLTVAAVSPANAQTSPNSPTAAELLSEASEIALSKNKKARGVSEWVLNEIGKAQLRAQDWDGARHLYLSMGKSGRAESGLTMLAEELAGAGQWERAVEALDKMILLHERGVGDEGIRFRWVDYLIGAGELDRAAVAADLLTSPNARVSTLLKIAKEYSRCGNRKKVTECLSVLEKRAENAHGDYRVMLLWHLANAQLELGEIEAARKTVGLLIEDEKLGGAAVKVSALWRTARLTAKLNDPVAAQELFRRAIKSALTIGPLNQDNMLMSIGIAQARCGFMGDAERTALMIPSIPGRRGSESAQVLLACAIAQLEAQDVTGAVKTAFAIEDYPQYRDDVLLKVVEYQIQKSDLASALAAALKIQCHSKQIRSVLKIVRAHVAAGRNDEALNVASQIKATAEEGMFGSLNDFSLSEPQTWGFPYDGWVSMASRLSAIKDAAEVAGDAMTVAHQMKLKFDRPYDVLFAHFDAEVVRGLARTHAASGTINDAVCWAKKIGASDNETPAFLDKRVSALLGVAEGMLDFQEVPKFRDRYERMRGELHDE